MPASALAMLPGARRDPPAPNVPARIRDQGRTANRILELQRTAGNRAVTQAIASVQREGDDRPDVISGADPKATPKPPGPRRTDGIFQFKDEKVIPKGWI